MRTRSFFTRTESFLCPDEKNHFRLGSVSYYLGFGLYCQAHLSRGNDDVDNQVPCALGKGSITVRPFNKSPVT
jgi:hypothetical protein